MKRIKNRMSTLTSPINRNSIIPYYFQLKQLLLEKIESNEWIPGDQIPTEEELCSIFDVSRTVVRQALQELENEGLIYRRKGKGTFIAEERIPDPISFLEGFSEKMELAGHSTRTEILEANVRQAKACINELLQMSSTEEIYEIIRLRYVDDLPAALNTAYLPKGLFPGLLDEDLSMSLTRLMRRKYGIVLTSYELSIEAVQADGVSSSILGVKTDMPLVLVKGTTFANKYGPVRFSRGLYRSDRLKFTVEGNMR